MQDQKVPVWVSERGEHLSERHNANQKSNIHHKKQVIIEIDGKDQVFTVGQICPICKHRIRGPLHCQGSHHRTGL